MIFTDSNLVGTAYKVLCDAVERGSHFVLIFHENPDCVTHDPLTTNLLNIRYDYSYMNSIPYTWANDEELVEAVL